MVNFYHCFIPGAAGIMHPLFDILRGRKPTHEVDWSAEGDAPFAAAKAALAGAAMFANPSPDAPVTITTNASDYAVGAT